MGTSCKLQIVLLLVNSLACSWAALPFGMTPCARSSTNLDMCVLKMARDTLNYIIGGHSKLFDHFDPLPLNNFMLNLNTDDLELHMLGKEVMWHGLSATDIRNFKFDLVNMKMSFDLSIPAMKVDGTLIINGHIGDLGVYADGERFPYATILNSFTDEFSAAFNFNLEVKNNASGRFLIPTLTSYNPHLYVGTVTLDNIFRAGYIPNQHKVDLLKKVEEAAAKVQRDLLVQLIGQLVPAATSGILQWETYDQYFPWTVSVGSVPAVTSGWLMVILIIGTSTLLKSI